MLVTSAVLMVVCSAVAYHVRGASLYPGDHGILLDSANLWISEPVVALCVNILLALAVALMMVAVSRTYSLLRATSVLDASLFLLMCTGTPGVLVEANSGLILTLVLMCCTYVLFRTFGNPVDRRPVFLIMAVLSTMAMTQYSYVLYIGVFVVGVIQMRIFTLRAVVAMLLGIITPWWLVLAGGLMSPGEVHVPEFESIFGEFSFARNITIFASVSVAVLLLIIAWLGNFPKMIAYNAHRRAYVGFLSVMALATMLGICADYASACVYAPTLFMCASFLLGHLFVGRSGRGWLGILIIMMLFLFLYICNLANPSL